MATRKEPGQDQSVSQGKGEALTVINAVRQAKYDALMAKQDRLKKSKINFDMYLNKQDYSRKRKGQSKEFLPKTSKAVELWAAFIKRGLTQLGEWYSVKVNTPNSTLDGFDISRIMNSLLNNLPQDDGKVSTFQVIMSDAAKAGLLESLITLKVHGIMKDHKVPIVEEGTPVIDFSTGEELDQGGSELDFDTIPIWRGKIDVVPLEDYSPDPMGEGLYEIHSVERDLHHVIKMAEAGLYDVSAVEQLINQDFIRPLNEKRSPTKKNQTQGAKPSYRKRVMIDEYWGTLLNPDGTVAQDNVVIAVANDRYLIRPPESNPFWHGRSPFVSAPLIRVPFSVWHKAVFDQGSSLNKTLNELFNLMLDGGIGSVWGTRQVRSDFIKNQNEMTGGIGQASVIEVTSELPSNTKVMEVVAQGAIPPDAVNMYRIVDGEFNDAIMLNDIRLGLLPPKQVKATEVVESTQSQDITLDSLVVDVEQMVISQALELFWLNILQMADHLLSNDIIDAIGVKKAMAFAQMTPEDRFAAYFGKCSFEVKGLSGTLALARNFQKIAALNQMVVQNPILLAAFIKRFSGSKMLDTILRALQLDPRNLEQSDEEKQTQGQDVQMMGALNQLLGQAGAGIRGNQTEPGTVSEANQEQNPLTGLNFGGKVS